MDERTKILIGIGSSVATSCQPCLTHHVDRADELGIEDADIIEAIHVGTQVKQGGMKAMQQFVERVAGKRLEAVSVQGENSAESCSCGGSCC
ncbi:carboxymuconolactone decarboxylase family protein [Desulfobotulus sp. H1]|uniref:Carboxymuconolactone decarboxylase family protein n=1 Tax=Desulfobotulus pelophilus TaxID=2823377 RepID=A0ABT3NC96_9BACT|nr:carboxymuconolactone decarboxylase family protein [Desulfobotulus pelophilus]MCW7755040.1 carboxymuconolactone decarboxylase family protein [Desulfobotulus pelophilus]